MTSQVTEEPLTYESTTEPSSDPLPYHDRPRRMSAHAEADAARAVLRTSNWMPVMERRQSWSNEDHKHAMHKVAIDTVKTGPGFSER